MPFSGAASSPAHSSTANSRTSRVAGFAVSSLPSSLTRSSAQPPEITPCTRSTVALVAQASTATFACSAPWDAAQTTGGCAGSAAQRSRPSHAGSSWNEEVAGARPPSARPSTKASAASLDGSGAIEVRRADACAVGSSPPPLRRFSPRGLRDERRNSLGGNGG